jgi:hypothetical protein
MVAGATQALTQLPIGARLERTPDASIGPQNNHHAGDR